MPRLDLRLKAVAKHIRSETHVDVGSDHGHLLKALLASGRVQRGIAVENKQQPFANSRQTLLGLNADVRFGDGLEPVHPGEADSLSVCGMGGELIVGILKRNPSSIPDHLVVQPNKRADIVRQWAWQSGYRLCDEQIVDTKHRFDILVFAKIAIDDFPALADETYEGLDLEIALQLGPLHIRRRSSQWLTQLRDEQSYLNRLPHRTETTEQRLRAITYFLGKLQKDA